MHEKWQENSDVVARVIELITHSGALLESKVAEICKDFSGRFLDYGDQGSDEEIVVRSERLIYSETGDENERPREVDQCVSFYHEFEASEQIGLQYHLLIPIECKHRKGGALRDSYR